MRVMLQSSLEMGRRLGLRSVAEGVETLSQQGILRDLGCEYFQGYLFARPLAEDKAEASISCRQVGPIVRCARVSNIMFSAGPATLSRATGAPLLPLFFLLDPEPAVRGGPRRVIQYMTEAVEVPRTHDREADIAVATRRLVAVYEEVVRRYSSQWYNFHDFWQEPAPPADLPARRRRARSRRAWCRRA